MSKARTPADPVHLAVGAAGSGEPAVEPGARGQDGRRLTGLTSRGQRGERLAGVSAAGSARPGARRRGRSHRPRSRRGRHPEHEPVADRTAIGRASRSGHDLPTVGQGRAVPAPRRIVASTLSVPMWSRNVAPGRGGHRRGARSPSSDGRPSRTQHPVAGEHRRVGGEDLPAPARRSRPARFEGDPSSAADPVQRPAVDLDPADPDRGPPGSRRSSSPRAIDPPRSEPVTTAPRPFTVKTRSIGSRTGRAGSATRPSTTRSRSPTRAARSSAIPAPLGDATARTGEPARPSGRPAAGRPRPRSQSAPRRRRRTSSTATQPVADPERVEQLEVLQVWARGPSSAATTRRAASTSPAPTSMFPTSRS